MFALTATPGVAGIRLAALEDPPGDGEAVVRVLQVGICGTDREIAEGKYGSPPPGENSLVIGHEVTGVLETPAGDLQIGALVTVKVRRGCGQCRACTAGHADSCLTDQYTEHGMLGLHGFAAERIRVRVEELVPLPDELAEFGVLVEPMSIVSRGVRHANYVARRQPHNERSVLILGAGTIGVLAGLALAMSGAEVCFASVAHPNSAVPSALTAAGFEYKHVLGDAGIWGLRPNRDYDLVIDATGSAAVSLDAIRLVGTNGVLLLLGIDSSSRWLDTHSAEFGRHIVEKNKTIIGSVYAGDEDWDTAVSALTGATQRWPHIIDKLLGLKVPAASFERALSATGAKAVLTFGSR